MFEHFCRIVVAGLNKKDGPARLAGVGGRTRSRLPCYNANDLRGNNLKCNTGVADLGSVSCVGSKVERIARQSRRGPDRVVQDLINGERIGKRPPPIHLLHNAC